MAKKAKQESVEDTGSGQVDQEQVTKKVGNEGLRAGTVRPHPEDNGDRAVKEDNADTVWSQESKDRWDAGNPDFAALLKQRNEVEEALNKE